MHVQCEVQYMYWADVECCWVVGQGNVITTYLGIIFLASGWEFEGLSKKSENDKNKLTPFHKYVQEYKCIINCYYVNLRQDKKIC